MFTAMTIIAVASMTIVLAAAAHAVQLQLGSRGPHSLPVLNISQARAFQACAIALFREMQQGKESYGFATERSGSRL